MDGEALNTSATLKTAENAEAIAKLYPDGRIGIRLWNILVHPRPSVAEQFSVQTSEP